MILIGLGGNLDSPRYGTPRATLEAALVALEARGIRICARSRWYRTAPVPVSEQPWFVNLVVRVETDLDPFDLLARLHEIEQEFGRQRDVRNAPRILDLDLIDYDGKCMDEPDLTLPHPRLQDRAFVLFPLRDVAPGWCHPHSGRSLDALIESLPGDQRIEADGPAA